MDRYQRNTVSMNRRNFLALAASALAIGYTGRANGAAIGFERPTQEEWDKMVMLPGEKPPVFDDKSKDEAGNLKLKGYKDYEFDPVEYNEPQKLKPDEGSEVHKLARILMPEARGYYGDKAKPTFMELVGDTVINRSKLTGQTIEQVITEPGQYSPVNPKNGTHGVYLNPLGDVERDPDVRKAWEVAWNTAFQRVVDGAGTPVTHFLTEPYADPQTWDKIKAPYATKVGYVITFGKYKGQREITRFFALPKLITG
ncbi:MAG: hypothetical protein WC796_06115 [Candidatus Pacearchaeota archaeon]|jgi:hypothetical protein